MLLALAASAALASAALAAALEVQTTVPVEIYLGSTPLLRADGPATVLVPNVPPGRQKLLVYRGGTPTPIEVDVAEGPPTRLHVGSQVLEAASPSASSGPVVELVSADNASFLVLIDGARAGVVTPASPLRLDALAPGEHTFVLQSADQSIIWVRGVLLLQPGDALRIQATEGRMVEVFGRREAWKPTF